MDKLEKVEKEVRDFDPDCPFCKLSRPGVHRGIHIKLAKKRLKERDERDPNLQTGS
jgi:hypothetical protein